MPELRVGTGLDVHPLVEGRPLVLGGVRVDYDRGLDGHSDGDALCHAAIDALLGAVGLGDIGRWFPSEDEQYRDASSIELTRRVSGELRGRGWAVSNLDATIVAEQPRLAPYVDEMRAQLAGALGVDVGRVSVKATTTDHLGFAGRGEGLAVQVVVLVAEEIAHG